MNITILGSCRQHTLKNKYNVTNIQEELSYPHYTKEILEVINYCKNNHIKQQETINIFRTPILTKTPANFDKLNNEFNSTNIFILEIASKIKYNYNNIYVHHIATEEKYNISIINEIKIEMQLKEEIEKDILIIKNELNKPFIIVSHLVTKNSGERYNLSCWLEEICLKYNIPFINPVKELIKKDVNLEDIFLKENIINHYSEKGHNEILKIYSEYIENIKI
jgi:hypothetical protein